MKKSGERQIREYYVDSYKLSSIYNIRKASEFAEPHSSECKDIAHLYMS